MPYDLKPFQWKQILLILRTFSALHTRNTKKLRRFIEAVGYINRSGCQWRLLPRYYGKWRSVHARFKAWEQKGVWLKLFEAVQDTPDTEAIMVDATIVRAHACAAGYGKDSQEKQALGRSKGGFTTKIHALVDALGNPLKFILTAGQRHEITQAPALREGWKNALFIADKGYDSNAFIKTLEEHGCTPVIPSRKNRKNPRPYDKHWYRERPLIECFFGKIKHFRRVFSRFDKTAEAFLSFLYFTGTLLWLR